MSEKDLDRRFALIASIATGDAEVGDIVAELKSHGIDSVEALVASVRDTAAGLESDLSEPAPVDFREFVNAGPAGSGTGAAHPVPHRPFLLNGTLYDPHDIRRFDGTELHFVAANGCLVAIDDRATIARWWQTLALPASGGSGATDPVPATAAAIPSPSSSAVPQPSLSFPKIPGPDTIPGHFPQPIGAFFWDDMNYSGNELELQAGRAYNRLSQVRRVLFGDWNDVISSVRLNGPRSYVLWQDKGFAGASLTEQSSDHYLTGSGWNDRASSIAAY